MIIGGVDNRRPEASAEEARPRAVQCSHSDAFQIMVAAKNTLVGVLVTRNLAGPGDGDDAIGQRTARWEARVQVPHGPSDKDIRTWRAKKGRAMNGARGRRPTV